MAMKPSVLRAKFGAVLRDGVKFQRNDSGASAVEFALVVPFLLFLVCGLFQFGITINNYLELTDGVRSWRAPVRGQPLDRNAVY